MTKYYSIGHDYSASHGGESVVSSGSTGSSPSSAEAIILMAGMKPDFIERHGDSSLGHYSGVTKDMFLLRVQYLDPEQKSAMLYLTEKQGMAIIKGMNAANAQGLEGRTINALLDNNTLVGVNTGK